MNAPSYHSDPAKVSPAYMDDLAGHVASQLGEARGEAWTTVQASNPEHDQHPSASIGCEATGARLHLIWSWYVTGKLTVTGVWPEGVNGRDYRANVDLRRGVAAVTAAADRRILRSGYMDDLPERVETRRRHVELQARRRALLERVTAVLGMPAPGHGDSKVSLSQFARGRGYVECYYGQDGEALNINLSGIPGDVMLEMLTVLAKRADLS
jgi:hypothetical protein